MQNCENCGGKKWFAKIDKETGLQVKHHVKGEDGYERDIRVFKCWRCGHVQEEVEPFIPLSQRSHANILYIDLETSKSLYFTYGAKVPSQYLNSEDLAHSYYVICWSASYVGSSTVWSDCVTPKEARVNIDGTGGNDKRILARLRELIDAADIIAGHSVDAFDIKKANTRFLLNGIEPVVGKKTLDTLKIARSKFSFESNKLDEISKVLGFRPKMDIRNEDWLRIVKTGDQKTLTKVQKYNRRDVTSGKGILERFMKYSGKRMNYGAISLESPPYWLKGKTA